MKGFVFTIWMFSGALLIKGQDADTIIMERGTYQKHTEADAAAHALVEPKYLPGTRSYQSEKLDVRKFDEANWRKAVGDRDYNEKPKKMYNTKSSGGSSPVSIAPWAGAVFQVIFYVVIAGIVVLLLYLVFRNMSFDVKLKRTGTVNENFDTPVENIEAIDIQSMLVRAKLEGNFRLAVRLYYLKLLKQLNHIGMINWKKDKTNRDFLSELLSKNYYFDEVRRLTVSYEQVWYGERLLTSDSFQQISNRFEDIYQKITATQP